MNSDRCDNYRVSGFVHWPLAETFLMPVRASAVFGSCHWGVGSDLRKSLNINVS
jgi:hypothetical protein